MEQTYKKKNAQKKRKLSAISTLHYIRLVYRSILFVLLLISYISFRLEKSGTVTSQLEKRPIIIARESETVQ